MNQTKSQIKQHWYLHNIKNTLVNTSYNNDKYKQYVLLRQTIWLTATSSIALFLQCCFNVQTKLHNNSMLAAQQATGTSNHLQVGNLSWLVIGHPNQLILAILLVCHLTVQDGVLSEG